MDKKSHWENVYTTKSPDQVSWYREHLDNSLKMILNTKVGKDAAIIDVGGGSSTLVDDLLDIGFIDVSVLDISSKAIESSRERLGPKVDSVEWVVGDITAIELPKDYFNVWHDRAVFHFLTDAKDRRKYVDLVMHSLKPGGHIIVASFGPDGPQKCSGLNVVRYSPDSMHDEFGDNFELVKSMNESHATPFGTTQEFIYCYCRKSLTR
jgi:ubiquinone/menaquinone biosynthesis C-methylase UbiE